MSSSRHSSIITHLEIGLDMMWTAHRSSPRIQIWDTEQGKLRGSLPCDDAVRKQYVQALLCAAANVWQTLQLRDSHVCLFTPLQ